MDMEKKIIVVILAILTLLILVFIAFIAFSKSGEIVVVDKQKEFPDSLLVTIQNIGSASVEVTVYFPSGTIRSYLLKPNEKWSFYVWGNGDRITWDSHSMWIEP